MTVNKNILDIGCGLNKKPGAIGIDSSINVNPDVLHNLNKFPYPFEDNTFDLVYCDNVLNELDYFFKTMEEIYRITKPGGTVKVINPYFRSRYAFIHPNIKSFFNINTFNYFDPDHIIFNKYKYSQAKFKTTKMIFNENVTHNRYSRIISFFANKYPVNYEIYLSNIFPLDSLTWYLKKV